jgi:hypothetical protein
MYTAAAEEADTLKIRQNFSLFQGRWKVFIYTRRRFFTFLAKPTRMGNTVCGGGQLFFMQAGGRMKLCFMFDFIARSYDHAKQRLAWKLIGK